MARDLHHQLVMSARTVFEYAAAIALPVASFHLFFFLLNTGM